MKKRLLAVACALIVVGRAGTVFYAGSPVPFNDQWYGEAKTVLIPLAHGGLHFGDWFLPNNEHVIAVTKLLSYLLVKAEGQWDCIAQMLVNCCLSAVPLAFPLWWALTRWNRVPAAWFTFAVAGVGASPLFYANVIWGFQSQVLVMCGCSVAHLYLFARRSHQWEAAIAGAALAIISVLGFASGMIAPAITAVVSTLSLMTTRGDRIARASWLAGSAAALAIGWAVLPHAALAVRPTLASTVHTAIHALGFPVRFFSAWGLLFWLPTALALGLGGRSRGREGGGFLLFLAGWAFCQIMVISIGRGGTAIVLAPRYYDIFVLGTLANLLLAYSLLRETSTRPAIRWAWRGLLAFWCLCVGWNVLSFARSHTVGDLPVLKRIAEQQVALVRGVYAGSISTADLAKVRMPMRPLADAQYLRQALEEPVIRELLPAEVKEGDASVDLLQMHWAGVQRSSWLRAALVIAFSLAGVLGAYASFVTTAAMRLKGTGRS